MRAFAVSCVCCLLSVSAHGQATASIDAVARLSSADRPDALLRIRFSDGGVAALRELEVAARWRADARRARGLPPLSEGCLNADEFDLQVQLRLARQSSDSEAFATAAQQFRRMAAAFDSKLADARRTHRWKRNFPSLRMWEREWRAAREPRTRELLWRTLNGQAIRAALARHPPHSPAVEFRAKGAPRAVAAPNGDDLAEAVYREYIFNLMCADDEENLRWFRRQVAEIGWFSQPQYGWAADRAALLIAQHADADPGFQESVVAALWPRLATDETDPENFAYLVDRVAVRARRPQSFGTQMECVNGEWIVPEIQDQATLDARRKRMNLVAYEVQLARVRGLCRD